MNKIVTTMLVSSLTLGGFALANASDDNRYEKREHAGKYCDKHGKGFDSRIERMTEHLGLNDEQAKQVRAVRDNYHPQMLALRDKIKANRKQLREVMHADTVDQAKVEKLAQKMGALKADKIILRSKMRVEMNKVLTNEQRKKMSERKEGRGHGHGYKHHD